MTKIIFDRFAAYTESDMGQNYLVVEFLRPENTVIYDYQIEMLASNPFPLLIPFEERQKDGEIRFYYNVTSKVPLKDFIKNRPLSKSEFVGMLISITDRLLESGKLLLSEKNFIINEEFVHIDPGDLTVGLVYLPADISLDHRRAIKEFVIGLATRSVRLELQDGDNYFHRIIESAKSPEFNISGFNRLLRDISGNPGMKADNESDSRLSVCAGNSPEDSPRTGVTPALLPSDIKKPVITALALQVPIFAAAAIAKNCIPPGRIPVSGVYAAIALLTLAAELAVFKNTVFKNTVAVKSPRERHFHKGKPLTHTVPASSGSAPPAVPEALPEGFSDETTLLTPEDGKRASLVIERDGGTKRIEMTGASFLIGRNPDACDIHIPDRSVGRVHAEIIHRSGEYFIVDRNSRNGTYLNDARLEPGTEYRLSDKDRLVFANVECTFLK